MDTKPHYEELKCKLEQMNYMQPFGYDSMDLVERLLWDLRQYSEKNKSLERDLEVMHQESVAVIKQNIPLKKENNRICRENSQLHLEMINQAEEIDVKEKKWERERRVLEGKLKEYQFLINQKAIQLKEKETQVEKLGHQLELLTARKNMSHQHDIQWNTTVQKSIDMDKVLNDPVTVKTATPAENSRHKDFPVHTIKSPIKDQQNNAQAIEELLSTASGAELVQRLQELNRTLKAEKERALNEKDDLLKKLKAREEKISELLQSKQQGMGNASSSVESSLVASPSASIKRSMELKQNYSVSSGSGNPPYSLAPVSTPAPQQFHQIDFLSKQVAAYEKKLKATEQRLRSTERQKLENMANSERLQQAVSARDDYKKQLQEVLQKQMSETTRHKPFSQAATQTDQDLWSEVDDIDPTPSQIDDIDTKRHIDQLNKQKNRLEHALVTYQNDKRTFVEALQKSSSQKQAAIEQANDLAKRLASGTESINKLQHELVATKNRLKLTENELMMQQQALSRLQKATSSGSDRFDVLHRQIEALENMCSTQQQDNETLKQELDHVLNEKKKMVTEYQVPREAVSDSASRVLLQQLTDDRNSLQLEIEELHQQNLIQRENLENEILRLQEKEGAERRQFQTENQQLHEKLDSSKLQCRRLESTIQRLKPLEQELPKAIEDMKERLSEAQKLLIEKETAEMDLKNQIRHLQKLIEESERESTMQHQQQARLHEDFEALNQRYTVSEQKTRRSEMIWSNKEQRYVDEQTRLKQLSQQVETRNENLKQQLGERTKELHDTQRRVVELEERLNGKEIEWKGRERDMDELRKENIKLSDEINQVELQKEDAEKKMYHLEHQLAKTERLKRHLDDCKQQSEAFQTEQQDKLDMFSKRTVELERELKQLKSLLSQMESEREDLRRESYTMQRELKQAENDKHSYLDMVEQIKMQKDRLQQDLVSHQELLHHLDAQRDQLQQELDQQSENVSELERIKEKADYNDQNLSQKLEGALTQIDSLKEETTEGEKIIDQLQTDLNQQQKLCEQYRERIEEKELELARTTDDLVLMTSENQHLGQECGKLNQHVVETRKQMEELQRQSQQLEKEVHAREIQLQDLMHTYRVVCDELQSLKSSQMEHDSFKTNLYMKEKAWNEERQSLESSLQENEHEKLSLQQQVHVYAQQVTQLTRNIQKLKEDLQYTEGETKKIRDTATSQHEASKYISKEHSELQQRSVLTMEQVVALESRLEAVQYENDIKNKELHDERQEKADLENLISSLRTQKASLQERISILEEERLAMAQEIRQLQQQFSGAEVLSEHLKPMDQAQKDCEELEQKLAAQSKTLKDLENSNKQFHRFAQKYEREIAKRDEIIKNLSPGNE